jgi:hypothetical protein
MKRLGDPVLRTHDAVARRRLSPQRIAQLVHRRGAVLCEQLGGVRNIGPFARPARDAGILERLAHHRTAHALTEPDDVGANWPHLTASMASRLLSIIRACFRQKPAPRPGLPATRITHARLLRCRLASGSRCSLRGIARSQREEVPRLGASRQQGRGRVTAATGSSGGDLPALRHHVAARRPPRGSTAPRPGRDPRAGRGARGTACAR